LIYLGKGMPGTDEWFAKDRIVGFSAAELPLGAGRIYTGIQETKKGNYAGGIGRTLMGVAEVAVNILSTKGGGSYKPIKPNIPYPTTGLEMPKLPRYIGGDVALGGKAGAKQRVAARAQNTDLYKQLVAAGKLKVPSSKIPAPVFGSVADQRAAAALENAFIGPILPRPSFGSVADQRAAAGIGPRIQPSYVNPLKLTSVPANPPKSTPGTPKVTKPKVTKPKETKPKETKPPAETPAKTPSPPSTIPMKYDKEGNRLNQEGQSVLDPTSDAGLRGWRPGDVKPKAPPVARTKNKTTTEWQDYQYRLDAYNKYNNIVPKKK
jgi:hypothetical protein